MTNFDFLNEFWQDLAEIGSNAEEYIFSDANASISKIGLLAEKIVSYVFMYEKLPLPAEQTQSNMVNVLRREGLIPDTIDNILYTIRKARNDAVHNGNRTTSDAKIIVKLGFNLSCWFMELYGDWQFDPPSYFEPYESFDDNIKARLAEQDKKIEELLKHVELMQTEASNIEVEEKKKQSEEIAENLDLSDIEINLINSETLRVETECLPAISYVLQQNGYELINSINIVNKNDLDIEDVTISVSSNPGIFETFSKRVELIPANQNISLNRIKLNIDVNQLINLTERQKTLITVKVLSSASEVLASELLDVDVLAYDQWLGITFYPELLASYVTPNHPYVARIVSNASEYLKKWTGDSSFDGYTSEDKNRVLLQAGAIYAALRDLGIHYVTAPASFEYIGQRVRLCDSVVDDKIGNCLDISLLYASCLEYVGINTILCAKAGHIFPGFWLTREYFSDMTSDDVSLLNKRLAEGINDISVVETTLLTQEQSVSFDDAKAKAFEEVNDNNPVNLVVDVKCCRSMKIVPLPSRIRTDLGYKIERQESIENAAVMPETLIDIEVGNIKQEEFDKKTQWERKLLDLGLRNSLINLHLSRSIVPILSSSLDELEDALYEGESFFLYPKPDGWKNSDIKDDFMSLSNLGDYTSFIADEFKSRRIHSSLTDSELNTTLKTLYRNAKSSLEENGANTLYIAIGLLKWCEPKKSATPYYAPLILLPVDIVKRSVNQNYVLSLRKDDEAQLNITILEKLKQDFQVSINGLEDLPMDEHGLDIRKILTIFRHNILGQKYWDVLESAYLGIFSFSQFVMWNDIHNRSEDLEKNKIVKSLIEGHKIWDSHSVDESEATKTSDSFLTLPVDGSQLYAIKEAEHGESFVLHGPPGTGKSQTITSIIADLLAKNKKVLFVAEKRAALEVVQKRINDLGLDPFCLELHSNKAKKKDVLEKIEKVFNVTSKKPTDYEKRIEQIESIKKDLDIYVQELHKARSCDASLYETLNKYEAYRKYKHEIEIPFSKIEDFTDVNLDAQKFYIDELIIYAKQIGHPNDHPLNMVTIKDYHQGIEAEIVSAVDEYLPAQKKYAEKLEDISSGLGLVLTDFEESYSNAYKQIQILSQLDKYPRELYSKDNYSSVFDSIAYIGDKFISINEKKKNLLEKWNEIFLKQDGASLVEEYSRIMSGNPISRAISLNKFVNSLSAYSKIKQSKDGIRQELQDLYDYQNSVGEITPLLNDYKKYLGHYYKYDDTNWDEIKRDLVDLRTICRTIDSTFSGSSVRIKYSEDESISKSIKELSDDYANYKDQSDCLLKYVDVRAQYDEKWYESEKEIYSSLINNSDKIKDWYSWNKACEKIDAYGLQPVVNAYYDGVDHNQIKGSYIKCFYKKLAELIIDQCQSLNNFSGEVFERKIEQFRDYDNKVRNLTKKEVFYLISKSISTYLVEHEKDIQLATLKKLIKSKGRGVSIRRLFETSSDIIQTLCPSILMSPISTAQYLDPSTKKFDYIIFDEASQLQTCKAVGAIARAENAIIVGDPKQMPPTNFFMTNMTDEENVEKEDLESILDDGLGVNMPESYLNWHYRSNHESLIAFSNSQFYDNKLYTFPSLNDRESKVSLIHVNGVFERGRKRTNSEEAKRIVDEIKRRYNDPLHKKESIGVVTFNISQQNLIDDLLTSACSRDKGFEKWVYDNEEPLFIKNLESVQGDERDVILFSVTYGPDEAGKISMNFGPLNRDGGWRRLNVAVSRARKEMVVFSSLLPEQINTSRTRSEGVAALKNFLTFATNDKLSIFSSGDNLKKKNTAEIAETISAFLNQHGYSVDKLVGHSDFKIDLCVVDPRDSNKYLLGILLDGDTYAEARYTRDREISQTEVLEKLGWVILRIWSIDWWNDQQKQLDKILKLIEELKEKQVEKTINKAVLQSNATSIIENTYPEKTVITNHQSNETKNEEVSLKNFLSNNTSRHSFKETVNVSGTYSTARPIYMLNENGTIAREFSSVTEAVNKTGVNSKSIRDAANGAQIHAGGYKWAYKDEYTKTATSSNDSSKQKEVKKEPSSNADAKNIQELAKKVATLLYKENEGLSIEDISYLTGIQKSIIEELLNGYRDKLFRRDNRMRWSLMKEKIKKEPTRPVPQATPVQQKKINPNEEMMGILQDYGFKVIDHRMYGCIYVIYDDSKKQLFEQIVNKYNRQYTKEFRGTRTTQGRPAWRIIV